MEKFIALYHWDDNKCYCALCNQRLNLLSEGKPVPCSCEKAKEARIHNDSYMQKLEELANVANAEADKDSFSLAEVLCAVSGCVICQVEPMFTLEKVCEKIPGTDSAKERILNNVTPEQAKAICAAADELVSFIRREHLAWETDISLELKNLAEKYQLPIEFVF